LFLQIYGTAEGLLRAEMHNIVAYDFGTMSV